MTKELERDDHKKGTKRQSMCSVNQVSQTDDKPRDSRGEPQNPGQKKRRKSPGSKTPIQKPPQKLTKKSIKKPTKKPTKSSENEKLFKQGRKYTKADEDAAEDSATKDLDTDPPLPPATDSDRLIISTTLQNLGKGSEGGPEPLTHTWSLSANYDPNFDLNVIGRLTVTAPDGQKRQFRIDVVSERHRFYLDSLTSANKKRKTAPSGSDDDETPLP